MSNQATNTLNCEIVCPKCGHTVNSGIGFRVGAINQSTYQLGERLSWEGKHLRPNERPADGNLKTIGYFECDNLRCSTWHDCFPEIQEALIVIRKDIISEAKPFKHKPDELGFYIIEPVDPSEQSE